VIACAPSPIDTLLPEARPAKKIADAFIHSYYVTIDPQAALAFCAGLACQTLKQELVLRGSQKIELDTKRPQIAFTYTRAHQKSEDVMQLYYQLKIRPPEAEAFTKDLYIKLRLKEDTWKVVQFREL
jgi:hypothetical protein